MKISVVYSLPTNRALGTKFLAADEDTEISAREIEAALISKGASVTLVPVTEDEFDSIDKISADLVFNLIEWTGLDVHLTIAAFRKLEALGIAFTGCSLKTLEVVANKIIMKEAFDSSGLPTPGWQFFKTGKEVFTSNFKFPVIVKPVLEHCSIGLTKEAVVNDAKNLRRVVKKSIIDFDQPVLAEEFITGREFQITLLNRSGGVVVLPPAEIIFKKPEELTFLTYNSRWDETHADYQTSTVGLAELGSKLKEKLEEISLAAYEVFGCRDYARIDIRTRGEEVYILEINPNPGLGEDEEYGMTVSYRAAGLTFADFIWEIVKSCLKRNKI